MEVARFWRTAGQRYQLIGEVCPNCGKKIFPPRDICPGCGTETDVNSGTMIKCRGGYTKELLVGAGIQSSLQNEKLR